MGCCIGKGAVQGTNAADSTNNPNPDTLNFPAMTKSKLLTECSNLSQGMFSHDVAYQITYMYFVGSQPGKYWYVNASLPSQQQPFPVPEDIRMVTSLPDALHHIVMAGGGSGSSSSEMQTPQSVHCKGEPPGGEILSVYTVSPQMWFVCKWSLDSVNVKGMDVKVLDQKMMPVVEKFQMCMRE
eukprot:PhF_6_TR30800/c0_g1_i1/m.45353